MARKHRVRIGRVGLSRRRAEELAKAFVGIEAALDELIVQIKSASIWLNAVTQKGGR